MANAPKFKEVACSELSNPIEGFEAENQNRLVIEREVLPIIFVPGIMGSRLGRSQSDKVWDPDSSWFMFTTYGRRKAESFHDRLGELAEKAHPETYQFYSSGIASPDRVVFKRAEDTLWEKVKRLFKTMADDAPKEVKSVARSLVFKAIKGGGNPLVPVLIDTAESLAGGAVVKDTDWYANRGGYRDRIDAEGQPGSDGDLQLVTMQLPDGAGDGTVPESSAKALRLGEDTKRTFCIGDKGGFEANFAEKNAPRTKPQAQPDFDEGFFDRGHEPIYKTRSAQFITCTAIENICRKQIGQMLQQK